MYSNKVQNIDICDETDKCKKLSTLDLSVNDLIDISTLESSKLELLGNNYSLSQRFLIIYFLSIIMNQMLFGFRIYNCYMN